jgi:hypothetical protein
MQKERTFMKAVTGSHQKHRTLFYALAGFVAVGLFAGFSTGKATVNHPYTGPALPRPARILVYDFTSDLKDVPDSSGIRARLSGAGANPQHAKVSRELGTRVATDLASRITGMGLYAMRASSLTTPKAGDIVFKGYFLSADEGDAAKRMALGFGSGGAELKVKVEGYQMTKSGLRFLGSGEGSAETGKSPGVAVGIGTTIATQNPLGLIIGGAMKAQGEASGKETIDGAAGKIAKLIAAKLEEAFKRQGWI